MSKKSVKSSKRTQGAEQDLRAPFAETIMRRAKKLAVAYRVILERNDELGFLCTSVELPTVFAHGDTPDACVEAAREALTVAVATMIECGQPPPQPSSARKRQVQVNIRLTPDEKLRLQEAARRLGFSGISDYVRAVALRSSTAA